MNSVRSSIFTIQLPTKLNPETISDLNKNWEQALAEKSKVVLLRGTEEHFCLGMDLGWIAESLDKDNFSEATKAFANFLCQLQTAACVTVAVVEGEVAGGGVGVSAACDFTIATTNSSFRLTEGLLGLVPGIILPALLSRLNKQVISKMVFTAKKYEGAEALAINLIDELVDSERLEETLTAWTKELKQCKSQPVGDLKVLLQKSNEPVEVLIEAGIGLLEERLKAPTVRERLLNLAFFNQG